MARAGTRGGGGKTLVPSRGAVVPRGGRCSLSGGALGRKPHCSRGRCFQSARVRRRLVCGKEVSRWPQRCFALENPGGIARLCAVGRGGCPDPAAAGKTPVAGRIRGGYMRRVETLLPVQETRGCGPQRAATAGSPMPDAGVSPNGSAIAAR